MNAHGGLIAISHEADPAKGLWSLLAPCLLLLLCGFQPAVSRADTLDVCPSGCPYSLVQAAVLAASDGDTIRLFYDGGQAGALIEPSILIDRDVTIEGFDPDETQLRGGSSQGTATGRVLRIAEGATVTLRNFILRAGSGSPGGCIRNDGELTIESVGIAFCGSTGDGGAIHNGATGTLQLNDVDFSENWSSGNGGHIYNIGGLLIHNSYFGLSYADLGGHIYNEGTMTVSGGSFYTGSADEAGSIFVAEDATLHVLGSYFQSNQASRNDAQVAQGGALLVQGQATIRNSTFRNNDANNPGGASRGGAISVGTTGIVSVSNSTLAQNGDGDMDSGGAIYVAGSGLVELANVTTTENTARLGGGISVFSGAGCAPLCRPGTAEIANSIIYGNDSVDENLTDDCNGQLSSLGYNLVGVGGLPSTSLARCVLSRDTNGLQFNVDPLLDTSFPSGSNPKVAPLQAGSPAIDAGNPAGCRDPQDQLLDTDQRNAPRVGNCDLGAYEYGSIPPVFSDGFESLAQ